MNPYASMLHLRALQDAASVLNNAKGPNKTNAGNGSNGICRAVDVSRWPSPDPRRSTPFLIKERVTFEAERPEWAK